MRGINTRRYASFIYAIFVFMIVGILFAPVVMAGCVITVDNIAQGPTQETERTIHAAAEVFDIMLPPYRCDFCCYTPSYGEDDVCVTSYDSWPTGEECHRSVCIDGRYQYYEMTRFGVDSEQGVWDVVCGTDTDGDGIFDSLDNCPAMVNPNQEDCDGNGVGDACETDSDSDGIVDNCDNCPANINPTQEDCDGNSVGDACEVDGDTDGIPDSCDNCPANSNPAQEDCDGNGIGDECDVDSDSDGFSDGCDNCPTTFNPHQYDTDGDGVGDECDDNTPPIIFDVLTNQGPAYEYIPFENWMVFSVGQEMLLWSAMDPDAPAELGPEWTWTYGVVRSLYSYRVVGETEWSEEVEMPLEYPPAGYFGQWKWLSIVTLIPEDGFYDVKLIAEDAAGNRGEAIYYIIIDTTDTDTDGAPDDVDNCPDIANADQADQDNDGIGDVCDEDPYFLWPTQVNQGAGGDWIFVSGDLTFSNGASEAILWTTVDPDSPDYGLGWPSRRGTAHSYVSYRVAGQQDWSPETETVWFGGSAGFASMWSWVYPLTYLVDDNGGASGLYEIKMSFEDADGNLTEQVYTVEVVLP